MHRFSEESDKLKTFKEYLPWVEKYRPKIINELVGNKEIVNCLKAFVNKGNIPNMILSGESGVGKTTSVLCLIYEMLGKETKESVMELNASDNRGIEVVRKNIKTFAKKKVNLPPGFHKIIILDEVDNMTASAQQALRRIIEVYSNTTRFVLLCNMSSKIIEPIQSRCMILRYTRLSEEDMYPRLEYICKTENIEFTEKGMKSLIYTADGDMRNAINNLESIFIGFGSITDENVFKVCDQPHPTIVKKILECCDKGDLESALSNLNIIHVQGYSPSDTIVTFFRVCRNIDFLEEEKLLYFIREIGIIHMRILEGCNSILQLNGLVARLCDHENKSI